MGVINYLPTKTAQPVAEQVYRDVIVIDYDGTVLDKQSVAVGSTYTLPTPPTYADNDNLTFDKWVVANYEIVDNKITIGNCNAIIGASPIVANNRLKIKLTSATAITYGKTVELALVKPFAEFLSVDWGDGTSSNKNETGSPTHFSHTYGDWGEYTITFGNETYFYLAPYCLGQTSNAPDYILLEAELKSNLFSQDLFNYCYSLRTIALNSSMGEQVGLSAVAHTPALNAVVFPTTITYFNGNTFLSSGINYCVIPKINTFQTGYNFRFCQNLLQIVFANNFQYIKQYDFNGCSSLEYVWLGTTLSVLSEYSFQNCYALKEIETPSTLIDIGQYSFDGCRNLSKVKFNASIVNLYTRAFQNCVSLRDINSNAVGYVSDYCFYNDYSINEFDFSNVYNIQKNAFYNCYGIKSVVFSSSSLSSIATYLFQYCYANRIIDLRNTTVQSIPNSAFHSNYSVEELYMPNTVTSISNNAFGMLYNIRKIVFPPNLSNIGTTAFTTLRKIEELDFSNATVIPTIQSNTFEYINKSVVIKVPTALYDTWIASTNWSVLANNIVAV